MHCEKCHKKKTTVIYHENINGRARTLHLCADCASTLEQAGELEEMSAALAAYSSPMLGIEDRHIPRMRGLKTAVDRTCPTCGISTDEIAADGRVGCSACYEYFRDWLSESLPDSFSDRGRYRGRVARLVRVREENHRRMQLLRAQLADSIATEQYEQAATLRDRIRELETGNKSALHETVNIQKEAN